MSDEFQRIFGTTPTGVWAAPGRVNLIGEHTDYNDGFVLPIALPHAVRLTAAPRTDGRLRLYSAQGDGRTTDLPVAELAPGAVAGWAAYPAGVVWALREAGHPVGGADLYFDSDVPTGAGLSSSAALEVVVAAAYRDLYGLPLSTPAIGLLCQRAENLFVGVPCGVMDQMASACCTEGNALFLDVREMTQRQVPLRLAEQGLELLVIDTRVKHDLGDGAYAGVRAGCERAAGLLGLRALRDAPSLAAGRDPHPAAVLAAALAQLPAELVPVVRHVVTENDRVLRAVELLDKGEFEALGPILTAGHASLRDDFRVSCAETDLAVAAAVAAGALGARMTGGGFGGSVIALVGVDRTAEVGAAVTAAFAAAGLREPALFTATAAAGARRLA
ncbi:galactokinase [Kitasatospora viridis]|uniref:Galactokinase n=1 Tax=Kitasatospora viridis TaxID=281105 RepID=A0A561UFW4_9ACTN|nr:galactokinase [Kitasatospora viridis]TWF98247.1 galactokinase [Kitasatospora viridis]